MQPRGEGRPPTKRARCVHCHGDWAYNETRLKTHIIDPVKGCQKVPAETRNQMRRDATDGRVNPTIPVLTQSARRRPEPVGAGSSSMSTAPPPGPPAKVDSIDISAHVEAQHHDSPSIRRSQPPSHVPPPPPVPLKTHSIHVGIEFSKDGMMARSMWIASELLQGQFASDISQLSLHPLSGSSDFRVRINGKPVWARVPGHPAPDYETIRPILMAFLSTSS